MKKMDKFKNIHTLNDGETMQKDKVYYIDKYVLEVVSEAKYMEETKHGVCTYIPCCREKASIEFIDSPTGLQEVPLMINGEYCERLWTNDHQTLINDYDALVKFNRKRKTHSTKKTFNKDENIFQLSLFNFI